MLILVLKLGCVCGDNNVTVKLNGVGISQVMSVRNLYRRWKNGERFTIKTMVNDRFQFMPIDIYTAKAHDFQIIDGKLMPSLDTIDGMGEKAPFDFVKDTKQ